MNSAESTNALTIEDLVRVLIFEGREHVVALGKDMMSNDQKWQRALLKAISEGAFLRLAIGIGQAGLIETRIDLVNHLTGEQASVSSTADMPGNPSLH